MYICLGFCLHRRLLRHARVLFSLLCTANKHDFFLMYHIHIWVCGCSILPPLLMFKFIHGRARTLFLVLATQQQLFESKVDTMDLFHYLEVVRKRQTETHACINSSSSSSRCISYGLVPGVVQPLASLENCTRMRSRNDQGDAVCCGVRVCCLCTVTKLIPVAAASLCRLIGTIVTPEYAPI